MLIAVAPARRRALATDGTALPPRPRHRLEMLVARTLQPCRSHGTPVTRWRDRSSTETTQMSSALALRTEISTRVEGHTVVERDLLTPRLVLAIIGVAFFLIVLIGMFREMKESWRQEPRVDGASPRLQPGR